MSKTEKGFTFLETLFTVKSKITDFNERLDRVETKIDDFITRLAKLEAEAEGMKTNLFSQLKGDLEGTMVARLGEMKRVREDILREATSQGNPTLQLGRGRGDDEVPEV